MLAEPFRVVGWNIRAGGGRRVPQIASYLSQWNADLVVLSEFRATPPSQELATRLADQGLAFQHTTAGEAGISANSLLIAGRVPLRKPGLRRAPDEPGRWLFSRLSAPRLAIGAMHVPNQHTGRKPGYHDAVLDLARRWKGGPALLIGDTNSGKIGLDEERPVFNRRTDGWFDRLGAAGWADGFRVLYPDTREYTWYSANGGNGFRLDQIFVNRVLWPALRDVRHVWAQLPDAPHRRDGVSDHAAVIADFDLGKLAAPPSHLRKIDVSDATSIRTSFYS